MVKKRTDLHLDQHLRLAVIIVFAELYLDKLWWQSITRQEEADVNKARKSLKKLRRLIGE